MSTLTETALLEAPAAIGPEFEFVDEVPWEELEAAGGFGRRARPLLVRGAVRMWPAWERWSFERLAALRKPDGSEAVARFTTVSGGLGQSFVVVRVAVFFKPQTQEFFVKIFRFFFFVKALLVCI